MEKDEKVAKRWTGKPQPKQRKFDKDELVFGVQPVLESLKSEKDIDKILIQREFGHPEVELLARQRGIQVQRVPIEKLNRITTKNHQGVLAFVSAINYAQISNVVSDAYERGEVPLLLVLDRLTDVRNFGAIARTAECAGVHGIVVPTHGAAQINADAMKTSSGALNFLPICREANLAKAVDDLKKSGIQIVACTEKSEGNLYDIDFSLPTVIVMGSEEDGISATIMTQADAFAAIPMTGKIGSLNVSVATGVVLYEAVRQRFSLK